MLMVWFIIQWFEAVIAKLIILPYQIGMIVVTLNADQTYYGWWTSSREEMALVIKNEIYLLYFSSWLLWHYVYSMIFALAALVLERFCATYFIEDYENIRRRYIPFSLIILTNFLTIPYSYLIVNNLIPFWIAFGQCVLNGAFVFFGYISFWRINIHLKNKISDPKRNRSDKYSLARKFQIEENIRSFKLAYKMVIAAVVYLSLALLIVLLLIFKVFQSYQSVLAHVFDNVILGAALILSLTLISCSPSWKQSFLSQLPLIGGYRNPRVAHFNFAPGSSLTTTTTEADVYFKQLKHAWL